MCGWSPAGLQAGGCRIGFVCLHYRGNAILVYTTGVCFGLLESAFASEVLAMEWALEMFIAIYCK